MIPRVIPFRGKKMSGRCQEEGGTKSLEEKYGRSFEHESMTSMNSSVVSGITLDDFDDSIRSCLSSSLRSSSSYSHSDQQGNTTSFRFKLPSIPKRMQLSPMRRITQSSLMHPRPQQEQEKMTTMNYNSNWNDSLLDMENEAIPETSPDSVDNIYSSNDSLLIAEASLPMLPAAPTTERDLDSSFKFKSFSSPLPARKPIRQVSGGRRPKRSSINNRTTSSNTQLGNSTSQLDNPGAPPTPPVNPKPMRRTRKADTVRGV